MAQRVYMIPIRPELVERYVELLGVASDEQLDVGLAEFRAAGAQHRKILEIGRRWADRLEDVTPSSGRDDAFYVWTAQRPYFITERDGAAAVEVVRRLAACRSEADLETIFRQQLERVSPEAAEAETELQEAHDDGFWQAMRLDCRNLRGMRVAIRESLPYLTRTMREVEIADGLTALDPDDTEPVRLEGSGLLEAYGNLVAATLGRLAGQEEPTWWLGRNYWLGLLLLARVGLRERLLTPRLGAAQKRLERLATLPAVLLEPLAEPGYETGMSAICDAYSTGLYFPPSSISATLALLRDERDTLVELGRRVTGYEPTAVQALQAVAEEAFAWAAAEGVGLLEGDELVGGFGFR